MALQQPGEISQNKIANYLDSNAVTIKNILDILEKNEVKATFFVLYYSEQNEELIKLC